MPQYTLDSAPLSVPYAKGTGDTGGTGSIISHLHLRRQAETTTACLDYGLPGRGTGAPQREGAFSSLCPFFTWTVTCQGSATLKTHGQVPGFREPTTFLHMVKTSTAAALAWRLRLDSRDEGKKNTTCKCTHSHSRALPSLVPLCTETLKSQLVLTLHITSIVSKEKRFMELKHPQEVPPRGRQSCRR